MRHVTRYGPALLLGASLALAACGGNNDNAGSADGAASGTAAGDVAPAPAMTDSAALSTAPAAGANAVAADLANLDDEDAMALIGVSNAGEIGTSKVAIEKATNADVKSYARDMVADHQAMQKEADVLAIKHDAAAGEPPAAARDKKAMGDQMVAQLNSTAKGAGFDRAYMDGQVQAHQRTLAELQALQNSSNAQIKALATKSIPKVQAHLDRAQKLVAGMGATP